MHTTLIITSSKEEQEKEVAKLLSPFSIDPIDVTRVIPQTSIGIGEFRQLRRSISLTPFKSAAKAVIIEEAQTLTIEAQNAFLKTLEEPPDHTIIILLTNNVDALLPTILSRCQIIDLSPKTYHLKPNELFALCSSLSALMQDGIGKRLVLAEETAKDKANALIWLGNMILAGRQLLLDEASKNKNSHLISKYLTILLSFNRAHTLLSTTNVNPRLTLEILFLSFPQTKNIISDTISS